MPRPKVRKVLLSELDIPSLDFDEDEYLLVIPKMALPTETFDQFFDLEGKDGEMLIEMHQRLLIREARIKRLDGSLYPQPAEDPQVWRQWPREFTDAVNMFLIRFMSGSEPIKMPTGGPVPQEDEAAAKKGDG